MPTSNNHHGQENVIATCQSSLRVSLRAFWIASLAIAMAVMLTPSAARADCANPTGVAGAMIYNTDFATVQFCNGTLWVSTGAATQSQWTATGSDIYYNTGSVAVGATSPNSSAILDLNSTTKGLLPPRMTGPQMSAIASPAEGLVAYDTDAHRLKVYSGTGWLTAGGDALGDLSCSAGEVPQYNGTTWVCSAMSATTGMNYRLLEGNATNTGFTLSTISYGGNVAVIGDFIYMFGGYNGSAHTTTIQRAPITNPTAWTNVGNIAAASSYNFPVVIGSYIYLFGGQGTSAPVNTIQRALVSNPLSWSAVGTLPITLSHSQPFVIGNYVYLFGGHNGSAAINTIYRTSITDPTTGWTSVGTLPGTMHAGAAAIIGDYVYMFGGYPGASSSNIIYRAHISNPLSWSTPTGTLPGTIGSTHLAIVGDYVYIIGGQNSGGAATNVIYRAPVSDPTSWTNTNYTVPNALYGHQTAVVGDNLYILGGYTTGYTNGIWRIPITVNVRQAAPQDVGKNMPWRVAYSANTGALQDLRIGTLAASKWCATNSSGTINCDQNAPGSALANLTDVTITSPTNGQSLVYNSVSAKWENGPGDMLASLSCSTGETSQWNGTAWICAPISATTGVNYKLIENGFVSAGTFPAGVYNATTAVIGDNIYSFGGEITNGSSATNVIYRASVNAPTTFTNVGTLPVALKGASIAVIGTDVYLFGGNTGSASVNTIYRATVANPLSWTSVGTLPGVLTQSSVAIIGNYVYLFGGYTSSAVNVIYRAPLSDPATGWTSVGTLPASLNYSHIAVIGNFVYLFGGYNGAPLNTIYRATTADPLTWTSVGTMPATVSHGQLLIIGDYVYIFAGLYGGGTQSNVILRAPLSDPLAWINTGATTSYASYGAHAFIVGDAVYTYSGYNGSYMTTIGRAPLALGIRQGAPVSVSNNAIWKVAYAANTGATQDLRVNTLGINKWCATDVNGKINCDQNTPAGALAALSDVNIPTPANGQSLVYNTATSKWIAGPNDALATLSCASGETAQWNGTAWICSAISATTGVNYRLIENGMAGTGTSVLSATHVQQNAIINGFIYQFGGHNGSAGLNAIYRASVDTPTVWTNTGATLPGVPSGLWQGRVQIIGDYIYIFGGVSGSTVMNTIFRASVSNPLVWVNTGGTLPGPLHSSAIAVIGGYVYLFGGTHATAQTNVIYRAPVADPVNGWVNTGATLPTSISHSQFMVIDNQMYLFGGIVGGSYSSAIYTASTSAPTVWTNSGSTLPGVLGNGSQPIIIGDYIYILGGYNGSAYTNTVYRAPVNTPLAWSNTGYTLPNTLAYTDAMIVGDNVYIFGGYLGGGASSAIWRAPLTLAPRLGAPMAMSSANPSWRIAYTANTGASQDLRLSSVGANKWCATDANGKINCDQTPPPTTLAGLSDVNASSPTNGQSLVYNSATSKWVAGANDMLSTLSCASGETVQWDGSVWICAAQSVATGANYRLIENGFTALPTTLPAGTHWAASAVFNGFIYLYGGYDSVGSSTIIYRASVTNPNTFTNVGALPAALHHPQTAVIGNNVYIFGGQSGAPYSNVIYRATSAAPTTFTNVGTLPGNMAAGQVAVIGGYVYYFGGIGGSGAVATIWRAPISNPETGWANVAGKTLPGNLYLSQLAVIGDYVYLFGGHNGTAGSNVIYRATVADPTTWTNMSPTYTLPGNLYGSQQAIIGDYVYLFGGTASGASVNTIYRAPVSDPLSWSNTGYTLPTAVQATQSVVVGDQVYLLGGYTTGLASTIWRAPLTLGTRLSAPLDVGKNMSWDVAYSANSGATQDLRINTLGVTKWCATDTTGKINCDQDSPPSTLAGLSDVTVPSPTNGQSLVFSSTTGKWVAGANDLLSTLSCATDEIPQWNGTTWICGTQAVATGVNYKLTENGFASVATMPAGLYGSPMATVGNYIYAYGGYGTTTIYRADVNNPGVWTSTGASLPVQMTYAKAIVHGGYVYLMGGYNAPSAVTTIYRASTATPTTFSNVGTLPTGLVNTPSAIINGYMYFFGGWNGAYINTIHRASLSDLTTFTSVGTMPIPMGENGNQAAVIGDYIYIFGGRTTAAAAFNTIYRASTSDPTNFTNVGTIPASVYYTNLLIVGDYAYLLGGYVGASPVNTIYRAPLSDPLTWANTGFTLPASASLYNAYIVGDYAYLAGGYAGAGALTAVYRATLTLGARLSAPVAVGSNPALQVAYSANTGATQDLRIGNLNASKWCAADAQGKINCDQTAPSSLLSALSDVNVPAPTNGQSLVYNSTTSKWVAGANDGLSTLSCAAGETPQWSGSAWVCATQAAATGLNFRLQENGFVNTGVGFPGGMYQQQLVVVGDYIYLYGGHNGAATNVIWRAPVSSPTSWTNTGATLPGNLQSSQAAVIGDYVYLFGGWTSVAVNVIYRAPVSDPTTWTNTNSTLPGVLSNSRLAVIGDYVYLFGGSNGASTDVIYRAPVSDPTNWVNTGAKIPGNSYASSLAVIGDYVYMFGGHNGSAYLNTIYRAPVSDPTSWTNTGSVMPTALGYSESFIVGDYVYLIAGVTGGYTNMLYRASLADPLTWVNTGAGISSNNHGHSVAVIGDNVYVFGGHSGGGYVNTTWRAPITVGLRQGGPIDIGKNHTWKVAYSANTGASQDLRLGTMGINKWCATDTMGKINCTQSPPVTALANLTDVNLTPAPTNGQALIYNTTASKWQPGPADTLAALSCTTGETIQWNGTAWICAPVAATTGLNYRMGDWVNTGAGTASAAYAAMTYVYGDYVYVLGGHNGSTYITTVQRAPVTSPTQWTNIGNLPTGNYEGRLMVIGNYVYVFGGASAALTGGTNTIYRADANNPTTWTLVGNLPFTAHGANLARIGDRLYIFGGNLNSAASNLIYSAPVSNPVSWTNTGGLMPGPIYNGNPTVIGDYIYFFSTHNGSSHTTAIWRAPVSNPTAWSIQSATMPTPQVYGKVAIIGDYVYVLGGHNGSGYIGSIYRAPLNDPMNFSYYGSLPSAVGFGGIAVVGDGVYFFTGYNGGAATTMVYRAPITMVARQIPPVDVGKNHSWHVAYSANTGAAQDPRIGAVANNKWCVGNGLGAIDCSQNAPATALANLSDVNVPAPTNGQSLTYNTTTSKWEAGPGDVLGSLSCAANETIQWNGTAWICAPFSAGNGVNYRVGDWVNTGASTWSAGYGPTMYVVGDYVYMVGGYNGGYLNYIQRAPVSNPTTWTSVATFPNSLYRSNALVLNGFIYLFGGANASLTNGTNNIWRASVGAPTTFTNVGTLPFTATDMNMAVVGNKIYIFGGYMNSANSTAIWSAPVSDPTAWTNTFATMPFSAPGGRVAVIGDKIYIFGGNNGAYLNNIQRASIDNPTVFTSVGTLPVTYANGVSAIIGDYVYLFGGIMNGGYSANIYRAPLSDPLSWHYYGGIPGGNGLNDGGVIGDSVWIFNGHNGSSNPPAVWRAPITLTSRQSAPVDVTKNINPGWRVAYLANTGATQDTRIGLLTAGSFCVANAGATGIDCNAASPAGANSLDFAQLKDSMLLDSSTDIAATGSNVLSITNTGTANSFVVNDQASDTTPFVIDAAGNVGIGTSTPAVALDVAGAIVSRVYNVGAGTSVDFTNGNVAYTSSPCGSFTLSGVQDGGSYVLVVKGSGVGPATFSHAGLTNKSSSSFACASAKHTVFAFVRAGTDLYITYVTGY